MMKPHNKECGFLRKYLADMNPLEAMEFVHKQMQMTKNNEKFLMVMNK